MTTKRAKCTKTKIRCFRCGQWNGRRCACGDGQTILWGDAREIVPQLGPVGLMLTDPPYGRENNSKGDLLQCWERATGRSKVPGQARAILNDGSEADDLVRWLFDAARDRLLPGGCLCCFAGGGGPDPQFARWSIWLELALKYKQMVVWDKCRIGFGWHYRQTYEVILVAQKPGRRFHWFDRSRKVPNVIRNIPKIIPRKNDHPTVKPIELMATFIKLHTRAGDAVVDPFVGGGTTLVAAKQLGRRGIGIELDKKWCQAAADRLGMVS